jgi:hypothetical protein
MRELRPLVQNGRGERAGDIAIKAPRLVPSNFLTKGALNVLQVSRRRAPIELLELGFQRVGFRSKEGSAQIILHKASVGDSTAKFNRDSGNIAAVRLAVSGPDAGPELAVFDTGRTRIDATRIPSPTSLDDPDSPLSILAKAAPEVLKLGARAAGMPQVGSLLAAAFPPATKQARRLNGTATDEGIRIADLGSMLSKREAFFARIGRDDRELDPPPFAEGKSPAEQWQYVIAMLNTVTDDVYFALTEFEKTPEVTALSSAGRVLTRFLVESAWKRLCDRSTEAFKTGRNWPLALRLLGFDDGAAHFVRRIAEGRDL